MNFPRQKCDSGLGIHRYLERQRPQTANANTPWAIGPVSFVKGVRKYLTPRRILTFGVDHEDGGDLAADWIMGMVEELSQMTEFHYIIALRFPRPYMWMISISPGSREHK